MGYNRKVIWSEGMFLRPQHFQQQERYLKTAFMSGAWFRTLLLGLQNPEIDSASLAIGKLRLLGAEGLLPDGTPSASLRQVPGLNRRALWKAR